MSINNLLYDIGAHTSFNGKIYETLFESVKYGMYATQFFMGNPQTTKRSKISEEDIKRCQKIIDRFPIYVFSHFPYISNLAGSVDSLAWNGNIQQDIKTSAVIESLEYELSVLSNFKNNGVVIHPGNYKDREKGLKTIAKSINKINFSNNSKLILENAAGQGVSLATTFTEIKYIIDNIEEEKKKHIGVCIDTCHLFSYGDYNLSKVEEVDRMFKDFEKIIGLNYLSLIHLNDSETPLKSKKDRHASIGDGHIWGKDKSSLNYLLDKTKYLNVPLILETTVADLTKFSG